MFDPKEFKDYMATLLDNDKWVHFDSELRKQEKYCFFGNELSATNKPKISIRIDDYSRQFYQKLKWFWKTTDNSTSKNCFPGWDDMGAECFYFPKENINGKGLDYWNAVKTCWWKYGGILFQPYDSHANYKRAKYLADKFGKNDIWYWIGIDRTTDGTNWRFHSNRKKIYNTVWAPGEPNNRGGNEKCVLVEMARDNKWSDFSCDTKVAYACEGPYIPIERKDL